MLSYNEPYPDYIFYENSNWLKEKNIDSSIESENAVDCFYKHNNPVAEEYKNGLHFKYFLININGIFHFLEEEYKNEKLINRKIKSFNQIIKDVLCSSRNPHFFANLTKIVLESNLKE